MGDNLVVLHRYRIGLCAPLDSRPVSFGSALELAGSVMTKSATVEESWHNGLACRVDFLRTESRLACRVNSGPSLTTKVCRDPGRAFLYGLRALAVLLMQIMRCGLGPPTSLCSQ